jgi:hypothetical protein
MNNKTDKTVPHTEVIAHDVLKKFHEAAISFQYANY